MSERDCENCKHHTEKGCDSWDCEFERRMARKEIIEMLKVLKEQALKSHNDTAIIDVKKDSFIYVMNVAINSLEIDERYELEYEQIEPCEDAISRQAVLDATVKINSIWNKITNSKGENLEEIILQLPSVNPQKPKTDVFDKIKAGIEVIIDNIPHIRPFENIEIVQYTRGFIDGLGSALDLIEKHKAESEDKE